MGQQGQQGSGDNALAPIWYASVTIIGAWLLWYYYHTIIVKYLLWLSYWQLKVIYLVYKDEILFQQIYYHQVSRVHLPCSNSFLIYLQPIVR